MAVRLDKVPKIDREALTDFEALLLQLVLQRDECIQELKDEIARLKGEKEKPKIKPSLLEPKDKNSDSKEDEDSETSGEQTSDSQEKKKRPGSLTINTDDTGARHKGVNSYCTHIGNEWFAWFETTPRKNRINFLELLRGEKTDYVLSHEALTYMAKQKLPKKLWYPLSLSINRVFKDFEEWNEHLQLLGFVSPRHIKTATEGVRTRDVKPSRTATIKSSTSLSVSTKSLAKQPYLKLSTKF